jgi:hypothetical protein
MLTRTVIAAAVMVALGSDNGWAMAHKAPRHHHHARIVRYQEQPVSPAPYSGATLVLHPAQNIACDTPYRSTRALPCDQPVWVYGRPCEIDLGLGRYRSCD